MKIVLLIQTGFAAAADQTSGLWPLVQRLRAQYPGATIEFLTHDVDDVKLADVVRLASLADWTGAIGHSFGVSHGTNRFATKLRALNRSIDFAVCIDPVPYIGTHFIETEDPFPGFPTNIEEVLAIRTLNKPGFFFPWGRRVDSPAVVKQMIFNPDNEAQSGGTRYIADPKITHTNIDGDSRVHDEAFNMIVERIG